MALLALGINHDSASIALREQVAFDPSQMQEALHGAARAAKLNEVLILSTCNRTEILAHCEHSATAQQEILHWLASYKNIALDTVNPCIYHYQNEQALAHMMRVSAGLDSMILGEPQIFGQMKSAYAVAKEAGTVHSKLDRALQHCFAYAKKVRTDTAIGQNPVSVAFACVHLAQKIFSDLSTNKALLIGAGETIDLVAKHLLDKNIGQMTVANRTLARAKVLAEQYGAQAILLGDISEQLSEADIVISSTASSLPILGKGAIESAIRQRKHRPMFLIDIAVPRDIEPEVGELQDVFLYTVDDLKDIIDENRKARKEEAAKAELIIRDGVTHFFNEKRMNDAVPYLKAYRQQAESMAQQALEKSLKQLANGQEPEQVLEQLSKQLTNKLIHAPSAGLKQAASEDKQVLSLYAELLDIQLDNNKTPPE